MFLRPFLFRANGWTSGIRTRDPNIKSVVLYQLSYGPMRENFVVVNQIIRHVSIDLVT